MMNRWQSIVGSVAAIVIAGCNQGKSVGPLDEIVASNEQTEITWQEIAPGVWERPNAEGGFERLGFGLEGFQFALERAKQERSGLLELKADDEPNVESRLHKNRELIDYLQGTLDEADELDEQEPLPLTPAEVANLASPSESSPSALSEYVCAGNLNLDVQFYYGMVDGAVETTASWSEFGPYAPYKKTLQTYSLAWTPDNSPSETEDSDYYGPFSYKCCASVSSYAGIGPTFQPMLYGSAYLSVMNGCAAFRFYEASNY